MSVVYDNEEFFTAYGQMDRSRGGLEAAGEWHQLQPMFPELEGKDVLDLGCGYGWHCRYAAEQGAKRVLGIDLSSRMIEKAKSFGEDRRISYQVCDLESYEYPTETWDCVVSNLALHYVEDLGDIYRKIHRTLRPDGIFCSISNTRCLPPVWGRTGCTMRRDIRSAGRWTIIIFRASV